MGTGDTAFYEQSSPSLLASTPSIPRVNYLTSDTRWQQTRLQLEQRTYSLRSARNSWWEHWAKIADVLLPRRMRWLIAPNQAHRGSAINQAIKDPTASIAMRVCSAGMRSGLMPSSRPWFKIKVPEEWSNQMDQDARLYCSKTESTLYMLMAGSNWYTSGTQMFEDLSAFGTAPMLIYEDRQSVVRCQVPVCGEYFLGADSTMRIDSFYRLFPLTLLQLVSMFGIENIGPELQSIWQTKGATLDQEWIVGHAIEPNFGMAQPGQDPSLGIVGRPGEYAYREFYWLWGISTPTPLSVRGFMSKPFIAPRWSTTSNDAYGRSPGMDALPDILQLHQMTMRQAEGIDKNVRPPLLASTELKNQPSSILPGRVTYVSDLAKAGMKPIYEVRPDIAAMAQLIEKIEQRVERWFFNDLFQMLENMEGVQPRTTMEIAERRGEKLQVLGPIVEAIEQELADAIRRLYGIAKRRGLLPPLPPSLAGVPVHIDIRSMIALAQEAAETASMERFVQLGAQMMPMFPDQNPLDNIDPDLFFRRYGDRISVPADVMLDPQKRDEKRQARAAAMAKQQQQAQEMAAVTHAAPAAASALKDVSQTEVGGGLNAIQLLTGMGGAADGITGAPQ